MWPLSDPSLCSFCFSGLKNHCSFHFYTGISETIHHFARKSCAARNRTPGADSDTLVVSQCVFARLQVCPGSQAVSKCPFQRRECRLCSRVSAVTTRASQLEQENCFSSLSYHTSGERGSKEGEQVPVDILTPLPAPPPPLLPVRRLARLEPSPQRKPAGYSTVGNTGYSPVINSP